MNLLTLLHRWAGGIVGIFLTVIGLTGAALVLEDYWIAVPHAGDPVNADPALIARTVNVAATAEPGLTRVTFASESLGVHNAAYANGGGAYISQGGTIVEQWASQWQRPELWLFDLHHHLLMSDFGKNLTGVLGLIGLFFVVSGVILWWRTRRTFRFRLWPARLTRSAIVRQHRDMGIVMAPLLFLIMATGVLMVFSPVSRFLLSPFGSEGAAPSVPVVPASERSQAPDWLTMVRTARQRYPDAQIRRLQMPRQADGPFVLRLKQPEEWTPNGRTYLYFSPSGNLLGVHDARRSGTVQAIEEKYYPLHAAKVGGWPWQALVFATGLALAMLGGLATYTFWFKR